MTQFNRYLNEITYNSFRMAAIEKVTYGITTIEEIKRVLPFSALNVKPLENHSEAKLLAAVS
ncbi:MAG: hypothetical protein LH631_00240 [Alkalinema sp. CAN_BIN05]|nr:hypothetical protein [Alkalinema sp. CAN_BIN05]